MLILFKEQYSSWFVNLNFILILMPQNITLLTWFIFPPRIIGPPPPFPVFCIIYQPLPVLYIFSEYFGVFLLEMRVNFSINNLNLFLYNLLQHSTVLFLMQNTLVFKMISNVLNWTLPVTTVLVVITSKRHIINNIFCKHIKLDICLLEKLFAKGALNLVIIQKTLKTL